MKGIKVEVHLMKGDPGITIPALAERKRVQLIVIGTVGRTGISGLVMGNTAETVLRKVKCVVLAVKPDGFAIPI